MRDTQSGLGRFLVFIVCLLFGWLGIDKLVVGGFGEWKVALVKLVLTPIFVGILWNLYDMVCALIGNYQINPLIEE